METRKLISLSKLQPTGNSVLIKAMIKQSAIITSDGSKPTVTNFFVIGYGEQVPQHLEIGQEVVIFDFEPGQCITREHLKEMGEYEEGLNKVPKFIYILVGSHEVRGIVKKDLTDEEKGLKKMVDELTRPYTIPKTELITNN